MAAFVSFLIFAQFFLAGLFWAFSLLSNVHEVQDLEKENEAQCGSNLPQRGCVLMISSYFVFCVWSGSATISLARNFRKVEGTKFLDFNFRVPPRSELDSIWAHGRFVCGCDALLYSFPFAVALHAAGDLAPFFTDTDFKETILRAIANTLLVVATSPDRRKRVMVFVTSKLAHRQARLASSLTAVLGRRNVKQALTLAKNKFRTISFENCSKQDYTSSWIKYDTTFGKTIKARLGSCDAFVSHSWADDGRQKFEALCEWSLEFKLNHGREPQLWLDKDCIKDSSISEDLACLPFFLSGTKKLIILAGPTYSERLWCIMEVFLFLTMGGSVKQIDVLPIEPHEKEKIAASYVSKEKKTKEFAQKMFENVDVGTSKCENENTRQMLLGAIEAGFSNFEEFNRIMRQIFKNEKVSELLSMKQIRNTKSPKLKKTNKAKVGKAQRCQVRPMEQ